jgi:hypothetical protein
MAADAFLLLVSSNLDPIANRKSSMAHASARSELSQHGLYSANDTRLPIVGSFSELNVSSVVLLSLTEDELMYGRAKLPARYVSLYTRL